MRINDEVAIQIGRDRHLIYGRLIAVQAGGVAEVLAHGKVYQRQLKRVRSKAAGVKENHRRKMRVRIGER